MFLSHKTIAIWRLFNMTVLLVGVFRVWVLPDLSGQFVALLFSFHILWALLIDPFIGIFTIGADIAILYTLLNLIAIAQRPLGRSITILLIIAGCALFAVFTLVPPARIGEGFWLTLVGLLSSALLETADDFAVGVSRLIALGREQ
jgi:hypothetical protein